ncbi:MAG: cytochrome-c peroxidase [Sulfurimonas sp.]|nr:cytochrome-c peroxidase [Sulfurimonas sp.]
MLKELLVLLITSQFLFSDAITPIPLNPDYDKEKAALGKSLFFDQILSSDGSRSCASCHHLPGSGADNIAFSLGMSNHATSINTPTVLNARFNFVQFWNGRVETLHEQALVPLFNPKEMGESIEASIEKLNKSKYKEKFENLFPEGVTKDSIAQVIEEFEKALTTPNSRFDKYLRGDEYALNEQELRGYKAFQNQGCISCHNGVNIGGNMYQKMGIMIPYDHTVDATSIEGRYAVTGRQRDKAVFKVPTLRNIDLTAPYLHDGSATSLRDVVLDMREHQLGILEEDKSIDDIVAFLKTLTGESPKILSGTSE